MVQKSIALCDGKLIGIESVFTVINGKQVNNPEMVKWLREKGRNNQLTCPCGCGTHFLLVAGDKNLRAQHFRSKDEAEKSNCQYVSEGRHSVESKIVLKCWLDDKLKDSGIESRVPISNVGETKRKFEFTFLSKAKSFAISYTYERENLFDEKIDVLETNTKGIKLIYITDAINSGCTGQYPENLMKIQSRQGYCLYLSIDGIDYYKAKLKAVFFNQDINGFWQEITLAEDWLCAYEINGNQELILQGNTIDELLKASKAKFEKEKELKKKLREQEQQEEAERIKKNQEEREREAAQQKAEEERIQAEKEEKERANKALREKVQRERKAAFQAALDDDFANQETKILDEFGIHWVKCKFCGKKAGESEFVSYGGINSVNLGTCYECSKKQPVIIEKKEPIAKQNKYIYDPNICPWCRGTLKKKNGKNGPFMGCSNYPSCRYTRNLTDKKQKYKK